MVKKFAAIIMLAIFAGTVMASDNYASSIRTNHFNKQTVTRTFITAALDKSADILWDIMDPDLRKKAVNYGLTKEEFSELINAEIGLAKLTAEMKVPKGEEDKFLKAVSSVNISEIWSGMSQSEQEKAIKEAGSELKAKDNIRKKILEFRAKMIKNFERLVVKNGNKWYVCSKKVETYMSIAKQSTQTEAVTSLCIATANGDVDILWGLICPADRKELIKEYGSEKAAKDNLKKEFKADKKLLDLMLDANKKSEFVNKIRLNFINKDAWVNADNKWYIDFKKLK